VEHLTKLLLRIPVSNAEAERSFSCLRRLRIYLRSNMGQDRLNHVAMLHVHRERLDSANSISIAEAFIAKKMQNVTHVYIATFGKFAKHA